MSFLSQTVVSNSTPSTKSFNSIAASIIDNILQVQPNADVKIGSVIRDLFINPQSFQFENLYNIATEAAQSQSIATATGAPLKRLGYNYNQQKNPPQASIVNVVVEIKAGLSAPTAFNIGDQFYTQPTQNNTSIIFINTQFQLAQTGTTVITLPCIALKPGATGNVAAFSITQSTYDFADAVFNPEPSSGGSDEESDASFAFRLPFAITSQYANTTSAMINIGITTSNVGGTPIIISPDNSLSRGAYAVDVYLKRIASYFGTSTTEIVPANQQDYVFLNQPLYPFSTISQISTYNPTTNVTSIVPPSAYEILDNASDPQQFLKNTMRAAQVLHWVNAPPALPYSITYSYDKTIVDAQTVYNTKNEVTADTLFKQATAIPIYVGFEITAGSNANSSLVYSTALNNLIGLFNVIEITNQLTDDETNMAVLQDQTILDAQLTNLDSTFAITLSIPVTSGFLSPTNNSIISPLGFYWEVDTSSPVSFYNIAARLWIGPANVITSTNLSAQGFGSVLNPAIGVNNIDMIANYNPSWQTSINPYFDSARQILILNFTTLPTGINRTFSLNVIQNMVNTGSSLSYLSLAPSLISPISQIATVVTSSNTSLNTNAQFATILPTGLTAAQANVYKNGVTLTAANTTSLGDYTLISGPDAITGLLILQFTTMPASTDTLQYGLLNPNLNISFNLSQSSRII